MKVPKKLEENDYYIENGLMVFTETYHLKRGNCCGSKCKHCPYFHKNVIKKEKSKET